jgi:hypothetical protein
MRSYESSDKGLAVTEALDSFYALADRQRKSPDALEKDLSAAETQT